MRMGAGERRTAFHALDGIRHSLGKIELAPSHLTILLFLMLCAGLLMLYAWPTDSAYQKVSPASVALMQEGEWVALSGQVQQVDGRATGTSIQLCGIGEGCVRVFASRKETETEGLLALAPGQELRAWGEVAAATGGTRYVRLHRTQVMD